jgi:hypothetical protein
MAWIKVTDPQGHPIYLNAEQIVRIRPAIAGAGDLASATSIVDLVIGVQAVRETQIDIIERIKNAGKDEDKAAAA